MSIPNKLLSAEKSAYIEVRHEKIGMFLPGLEIDYKYR